MAQPIPPVNPTSPDYGGIADDLVVPAAVPVSSSAAPYQTDGGDQTSGGQSTVEATKEQASQVTQSAAGAGQHVAQVAKEQLGTVAGEAGRQTRDLLAQGRSELAGQAGQQKQRVTSSLQTLSSELHTMAQHEGAEGLATDLARQGAQKVGELASWLESREPGELVDEVKSFARRRPGTFLLLAAGLGLAAGRLTRGVTSSGDQSAGDAPSGSGPAGWPAAAVPPAQVAGARTEVLPSEPLFSETVYAGGLTADTPLGQPGGFDDMSGRLP
jgi:hypothetical protein